MFVNYGFYPTRNFLTRTTIHGPKIVASNKHLITYRSFFLLVCLAAFSFCSWQVSRTFSNFLKYGTKITVTSVNESQIEFPAVTICSNNANNRLFVGSTDRLVQGAYLGSKPAHFDIGDAKRFCDAKDVPVLNISGGTYPPNYPNMSSFMRDMLTWSGSTVLACRIKGKLVSNCADLCFNKMTDSGFCFTFNQDPQLIKDYPTFSDKISFGSTTPGGIWSKVDGRYGGISMLLISNQTQYCIPADQYTAGFVAIVHSRDVEPILYKKKLVDLVPGFVINVGIRVSKISRNLENWPTQEVPMCYNHYPLTFYPKAQVYRNGDNWVVDCLTKHIWEGCNCLPSFAPPQSMDVVHRLSMDILCSFNATGPYQYCMDVIENKFLRGHLCKPTEVPKPCEETKYTTTTTASLFMPGNEFNQFRLNELNGWANPNILLEEFRKNFLTANFYIASMETEFIKVNPAMTWIDLMNQMGGAVGMAMGVSLLSVCEVVNWLILMVTACVLKLKKVEVVAHTRQYLA